MAEKNFPDLDKLSNILPLLGLRPRGSKNSVWKVIFPSHYGNSETARKNILKCIIPPGQNKNPHHATALEGDIYNVSRSGPQHSI